MKLATCIAAASFCASCVPPVSAPKQPLGASTWPIAVQITSFRWNVETQVDLTEGALLALEPGPVSERVTIDDAMLVENVARMYRGLRHSPRARGLGDTRIEALLIWRDGALGRVGVPATCWAMTRDGVPVEFDRPLFQLLISRLSAEHRRALGGACGAARDSAEEE